MKSRILNLVPLLCIVVCFSLAGCAPRSVAKPVEAKFSLGVAAFEQPTDYKYLLGSYLPEHSEAVSTKELTALDDFLTTQLRMHSKRRFVPPDGIISCQKEAKKGSVHQSSLHAALDYWVNVGQCANVEYLLVPQLLYWKERVGGPAGVEEPAGVLIDFFVINVKEHEVTTRFRFEETQVSLTENLLTIGKFFSRGGKWVTAHELAQYGIDLGLRKVGLL